VLAKNWSTLNFGAGGVATNFEAQVVAWVRVVARRTIDIPAILRGFLTLGRAGCQTAALYDQAAFDGVTLQDLPDRPRFVFNATNLQSGVLWRFSKPYMADYRVGELKNPSLRLSTAVAASSAFPPVLSPLRLSFRAGELAELEGNDLHRPPYTTDVRLTDGGVYDNLGLETAWKRCDTILISDGGGHVGSTGHPPLDWLLQFVRVAMLLDAEVGSLRKQQAIDAFVSGKRKGTYWGIASDIKDFGLANSLPFPVEASAKLAAWETRLRAVPGGIQNGLINWGYAICDTAMRKHLVGSAAPPGRLPYQT
jgi:NTE family protein